MVTFASSKRKMQINISPNQTYPNMLPGSIHDILEMRSNNPSSPRNSWRRMPRWLPGSKTVQSLRSSLVPSWQIHQFSSVRCHIQVHVRCCSYECLKYFPKSQRYQIFATVPRNFGNFIIRYPNNAPPTFQQSECHTLHLGVGVVNLQHISGMSLGMVIAFGYITSLVPSILVPIFQ